jgi:hypothetical protein
VIFFLIVQIFSFAQIGQILVFGVLIMMKPIIMLTLILICICLAYVPLQYAPTIHNLGNLMTRMERFLIVRSPDNPTENELV